MTDMTTDIAVSHPDKLLYPNERITKAEVVDYYRDLADVMVPHLRGRPLTMHRFPDGIGAHGFFQQQASEQFPDWLHVVEVPQRSGTGTVRHAVCDDAESLVYLANQAVLEFHIWLSTVDHLDNPDRLVIDLDPPDGIRIGELRDAVRRTCDEIDHAGLVPFVQTTGGRGFHVAAPLDATATFDEVRAFTRDLADQLVHAHPDRFTTEQRKNKRGGRILLDTNRNAYGQTAVAPYSLRARPGAPAATPIDPDELSRVRPQKYGLGNLRHRLVSKADPWVDIADLASPIPR
ncbi:MAG TPA: non-homologous end-joining DNA ligase [Pseudonocardiaceae bacterium]|jgi:bifunctional non-homologous end joining protein LigD|nr:non-homologous end-joining DNA ligase [Pseudonocardiaceae bacterium]